MTDSETLTLIMALLKEQLKAQLETNSKLDKILEEVNLFREMQSGIFLD